MDSKGILPTDLYNMDEIGFLSGLCLSTSIQIDQRTIGIPKDWLISVQSGGGPLYRPRRAASTEEPIPKPAINAGDSSYRAGTAKKTAYSSGSCSGSQRVHTISSRRRGDGCGKPYQGCRPDSRQGQQTRQTCCPGDAFVCQRITHPGAYRGPRSVGSLSYPSRRECPFSQRDWTSKGERVSPGWPSLSDMITPSSV